MSRKQNLIQQDRRRKKRGLKSRRVPLMSEMVVMAIKSCGGVPIFTPSTIKPHEKAD